ncbi:MAG: hypothetical protein U0841_06595 [Chloroflexia bacterium]
MDEQPRVNHEVSLSWTQPTWLPEVESWVRTELERQGISLHGPLAERQLRPWSAVLTAPTSEGNVYFKATAPSLAHEPALTELLARRWPEWVPTVLASDLERGWLLLADAGVTLRSLVNSAADLHHWERILPRHAEMQIALAGAQDELLELRCARPAAVHAPAQYAALLADTEALRIGLPDGLSADEHARLVAFAPQFAARCAELASYGLPETLHHDDFHDANIFVRDGRYALADWGELRRPPLLHAAGEPAQHRLPARLPRRRAPASRDDAPARCLSGTVGNLRPAHRVAGRVRAGAAVGDGWASDDVAPCRLQADGIRTARPEADAVPGWLQEFLGSGLLD